MNSWKQADVLITKKRRRNIPGKMMVLLLKKRKNICFTNKIHKRPAIAVNFSLAFFFCSTPTPLYSSLFSNFLSFFFPFLLPPYNFGDEELAAY
jgi:hypothetical protein